MKTGSIFSVGSAVRTAILVAWSLMVANLWSQEAALPTIPRPNFPGAGLFNDQPPFLAGVALDRADGIYRDGDTFRVQLQAERAAHLYLLYHQADGSSLLLFPNEVQPSSRIPARGQVVIPPADDTFRFRVRPPFGNEVLQVLAATEPLQELESLVQKRGRAAPVEAAVLQRLTERLAKDRSLWAEHRVQLQTQPADAPAVQTAPARVGLFIGIGNYQFPDYAPTHEELRRSAEVMHDLMLKHGGLDPQRTALIRDAQATKANLQKLISQWLPSVTRPGDTVFIYFSGHAGQIPTNDPTEADGLDETIGPYELEGTRRGESRAAGLARFRATNITDDTLAAWLAPLAGRQVVLIFDTCHSGGLAGDKAAGEKAVGEKSADGKLLVTDLGKSFWLDEAARVKDIVQLNTLVLTSCAADEQSLFEGTPNKTMWFTFCLSEAIELAAKQNKTLSAQGAFEYSKKRLRTLLAQARAPREQEPTLTDRIQLPVQLVPAMQP